MPDFVTDRQINRSYLARQLLLERVDMPTHDAIEHLIALQAQDVMPPYVGLWSRLTSFDQLALSESLVTRSLVRATSLRPTVHLTTKRDALRLLPIMLPGYIRMAHAPTAIGGLLGRIDVNDVISWGTSLLAKGDLGNEDLRKLALRDWPIEEPQLLASAVQWVLPLCQVPPRGLWKTNAKPRWAMAEQWLGEQFDESWPLDGLVLRYLRAFGPMAAGDIQTWSRLTGLKPVIDRLRPNLQVLRDERGRELLDLPDAPWPDENTPAPVRLLGAYDNLWLAHKDRSRVLDERYRVLIMNNGIGRPAILVDGFVSARYRIEIKKQQALLHVQPFRELMMSELGSIDAEAHRLLEWMEPGLEHEVTFLPVIV